MGARACDKPHCRHTEALRGFKYLFAQSNSVFLDLSNSWLLLSCQLAMFSVSLSCRTFSGSLFLFLCISYTQQISISLHPLR